MLKFVRSIIRSLTGKSDRNYTADGRPDEKVTGKMYQHYGFKSNPPPGVELVHMEQGNLGFSVAENDGNLLEADQAPGDLAVYTTHSGKINSITMSEDGIALITDTSDLSATNIIVENTDINIEAKGEILISAGTGTVNIGNLTPTAIPTALANQAFINAVGVALTALGQTGFDPATIATGVYNTKGVKAT